MKTILLTDTHFGARQNSMFWFNNQMKFFTDQFIPYIKHLPEPKRIVHLGDVFDIRSSTSTFIATEVRKLFQDLGQICEVIVIGGNHDFYAPNTDQYCALDLVLSNIPGVRLVLRETYEDEYGVYIPWYVQESEGITELSKKYKGRDLFTHADLVLNKPKLYTNVFSGHIHIPLIDGFCKNLGSCFPLTFADHDSERGFYVYDGDLQFIPNTESLRFWRVYGDDFGEYGENDYIEWYVDASKLLDEEFSTRSLKLRAQYNNLYIIPRANVDLCDDGPASCDIQSIIDESIPEDLKEPFKKIKNIVEGQD